MLLNSILMTLFQVAFLVTSNYLLRCLHVQPFYTQYLCKMILHRSILIFVCDNIEYWQIGHSCVFLLLLG